MYKWFGNIKLWCAGAHITTSKTKIRLYFVPREPCLMLNRAAHHCQKQQHQQRNEKTQFYINSIGHIFWPLLLLLKETWSEARWSLRIMGSVRQAHIGLTAKFNSVLTGPLRGLKIMRQKPSGTRLRPPPGQFHKSAFISPWHQCRKQAHLSSVFTLCFSYDLREEVNDGQGKQTAWSKVRLSSTSCDWWRQESWQNRPSRTKWRGKRVISLNSGWKSRHEMFCKCIIVVVSCWYMFWYDLVSKSVMIDNMRSVQAAQVWTKISRRTYTSTTICYPKTNVKKIVVLEVRQWWGIRHLLH